MKVIAGLGNVGDTYKKTRHNVGFMVVDQLSKKYHIPFKEIKYKASFGQGIVEDKKILIVKPLTFMNLSGVALKKLLYKYSVPGMDLTVIHDEIDLPLGQVKKKIGGGDAGHRGVRSIIQSLDNNDFSRIRVGIGRPADNNDISDWVLSPFLKDERLVLKDSIDLAIKKIEELLT